MKKRILLWVLIISTAAPLCAQTSNKSDAAFEVPSNILFNRKFFISLQNGNRIQISITDITDLSSISNLDSLLRVFLNDIAALKDSFSNPLTSKRIDYLTDESNRKKIRFQQFQPKGASFFLNEGELASLRTEQDTIHLIGIIATPSMPQEKISKKNPRYYHIIFYLNDFSELNALMNGQLNTKMATLQANTNDKWVGNAGTGYLYLKKDTTISANQRKGFQNGPGDYLNLYATVNVQNYKNYFVPSFSLGGKVVLADRDRFYKREIGLMWEPHFIFANDNNNKLQTYRNDFLTLNYGQGPTKEFDSRKETSLQAVVSLGYLIRRQGEYFQKNTFRFGAGKLQLSKISIEPSLYFNNFFKGVTPGIRITQSF